MPLVVKRHPNATIAMLLLAVAGLLFAPYLLQPNTLMWPRSELGTDMLTYNWTSIHFFRESLRATGQIPLWQGTSVGGLPMVGNPAIRVFYPPQLLFSLLPVPILWAYAVLNVFHFWLAGMGGYGLARSVLKLDYPAALIGGLLVMLTPRLSSNIVGDVGYTYGLCWTPLCLLWMRLAFDRLSWRWAIATGVALCAIYLTNIQFILYGGWFVGVYFLYCCVEQVLRHKSLRVVLPYIGVMVVIFATFLGLSAFNSFPFASYLSYQSRHAMTLADANYLALPAIGLMNTVFPIAQKFPEWEIYVGLLPLMFAPLVLRYASRRELGWWGGVLIFAVLFSLGSATPLYPLMFYGVPGFSFLRVPVRMWYVAAIVLALLIAVVVDGLLRERQVSSRAWRWLGGSAFLLILLTLGGRYVTRRGEELDWLLGLIASAGVIASLIGLRLWQVGRLKASAFVGILMVAVMADLFPLDMAFGRPRPISDFLQVSPIVERMLQEAKGDPSLYRVYTTRREISDVVAVANGLQTFEGLNSFQFASYAQFARAASGCNPQGLAAAVPPCISNEISETAWVDARPDAKLLGLLNTRYVISSLDLATDASFKLIDTIGDERLYENLAVRPRAFMVGRAEVVSGEMSDYLAKIGDGHVALLDDRQSIDFELPQHDFVGSATITRYTPNEITVDAGSADSGILVLGEAWVPGWIASVDGVNVPVLRVNGALRGVYLTAGQHTVSFVFRPIAFVVGVIVTVVTLLLVGGLFVIGRSKESSRVNSL